MGPGIDERCGTRARFTPVEQASRHRSRVPAALWAQTPTSLRFKVEVTLMRTSGPSTLNHHRLPGGASRLAALLIAHLCPARSLFAPCDPGAALGRPVPIQRGRATRHQAAL